MPSDDLYDDAPEPAAEAPENSTGSGLLPKEFFQGKELKPGARCEVEVESVQEDSVLVKYVPHATEPKPVPEAAPEEETADMYA